MDAGYGVDARLRLGVTALGLSYVAGVPNDTLAFAPGHPPAAGHTRPKSGRRQRHVASIKEIALGLPAEAWTRSNGAKAWSSRCRAGSRGCGSARPIATVHCPNAAWSGC